MEKDRKTADTLLRKKREGKKITMLTAYDFFMGSLIDSCGIDAILVGDSLGMVILGHDSTRKVTMDDMITHVRAVRRGVKHSLLIGDMPYRSFDEPHLAVKNASLLAGEEGCQAVKIEGEAYESAEAIIKSGIPVMGHLGLTPQTAETFKVRGNDAESAKKILEASLKLESLGCFALVLECIPAGLADIISSKLSIPTIGIGAGPHCDGQVLVVNDILGLYDKFQPRFVKRYADLAAYAEEAVKRYKREVESLIFPDSGHSYKADSNWLEKF